MRQSDPPCRRSPSRAIRFATLASLVAALGLVAPWSANPTAQAGTVGQWQTLPITLTLNPIHMALLNTGKVLIVVGSGNDATVKNWKAVVIDPQTGAVTKLFQQMSWDMFCNGMVTLPDGRVFINGGNLKYDPFWGEPRNAVFDPVSETFTNVENMAHGRWYPTPTVLGDGRVMTFSGLKETGGTNTTVEIYTPGAGWSQEYTAGWTPPLYPRMHLLPNGRVFYAGSGRGSRIFNPADQSWTGVIANTIYTSSRNYGTSVLLPLSPTDNYRGRVMIFGGGDPATATTEVIEPLASTPAWQNTVAMSQSRIQLNATILPSGRVLVTGGSAQNENASTASLNADLFSPEVTPMTRTSAGASAFPRLYHSNAVLLPDARVLLAGGNPTRGSYEARMEIYSPAYLFNADHTPATRPTITQVPSVPVEIGATFQVQTPDAASIASVVLVRPGTPTHAFDMDQRMIRLVSKAAPGVLSVVAPPNGNVAPPGYYMLFVLNTAGVPSVARFVRLVPASGGGGAPPTLSVAPTSVMSGAIATATWSTIAAATATDWLGIYTPGAADAAYLDWAYVSCAQAAGSAVPAGSCGLSMSPALAPGAYQVRLFRNGGYSRLATSNNFTLGPPPESCPFPLCVSETSVTAGSPVTVTWRDIEGATSRDWIGLYKEGSRNSRRIDWMYVSCSKTAGSPAATGECSFPIDSSQGAGTYNMRLFRDNATTPLAISNEFDVRRRPR